MASVTVHVLNDDQNPVRGKRVHLDFPDSGPFNIGTHSEDYTDEEGIAYFEDVPVEGEYLLRWRGTVNFSCSR